MVSDLSTIIILAIARTNFFKSICCIRKIFFLTLTSCPGSQGNFYIGGSCQPSLKWKENWILVLPLRIFCTKKRPSFGIPKCPLILQSLKLLTDPSRDLYLEISASLLGQVVVDRTRLDQKVAIQFSTWKFLSKVWLVQLKQPHHHHLHPLPRHPPKKMSNWSASQINDRNLNKCCLASW